MAIGIVSYWFNRGQGTVGRYIRSTLDDLGYETRVLARPTKDNFVLSRHVATSDVWDQPGVTAASCYEIPTGEYLKWAKDNDISVAFFDQNYQFDAIAALRAEGVVTIGRFVWESFGEKHVADAKRALSVIYSLTRCEQERYSRLGIDSPFVPWGCHPELAPHRKARTNEGKSLLYIGGYLSNRKPTAAAVAAFRAVTDPSLRLTVKTQRPPQESDFVIPKTFADVGRARKRNTGDMTLLDGDARIKVVQDDMEASDYYDLFAGFDVALAPSRWEGLGLHLYEALALGVPTISCDIPPINEVITHGVDGLLVKCHSIGTLPNGIAIYEPTVEGLRDAIKTISSGAVAERLARNTEDSRRRWSWDRTRAGYSALLSASAPACR